MFGIIGLLSIVGSILLYSRATYYSPLSQMFSAGYITVAGMAVLAAIGIAIAGILSCFSNNGRRKACIIFAAISYLLPALLCIGEFEKMLWAPIGIVLGLLYFLWVFIQKYE